MVSEVQHIQNRSGLDLCGGASFVCEGGVSRHIF